MREAPITYGFLAKRRGVRQSSGAVDGGGVLKAAEGRRTPGRWRVGYSAGRGEAEALTNGCAFVMVAGKSTTKTSARTRRKGHIWTSC
jgi:hypothetical protein